MVDEYRQIDYTVDENNCEPDIWKLLEQIRPEWKREKLNMEQLFGGSLNKSFKVTLKDDPITGLVFRVNGPIPEKVGLTRVNEVKFLRHFNKHSIGVPLCASFNNGIVAKLVPGKTADPETDLVDPKFISLAARYVARHHHATPRDWPRRAEDGSRCSVLGLAKTSIVRLKEDLDPESYKSYADELPFDTIDKELDELAKELEELDMPVVLSHNDIWQENLIYDKETGSLEFIDYEMSNYNYSPYDIASYMATQSGIPPIPEKKPTAEQIRDFICIYLDELARLEGRNPETVTDKDVEMFYVYTIKCMQLFQLFHVPLILYLGDYQNRTGRPIIDFFKCVKIMYSQYLVSRKEFKDLKLPH